MRFLFALFIAMCSNVAFAQVPLLVKDINQGAGSSLIRNGAELQGAIYFTASDGINGGELWRSDGSSGGTVMVRDIYPTPDSSSWPTGLTAVNGILLLAARDSAHGLELWRSDGTEQGTYMVKDILPDTSWSRPSYLTEMSGALYFVAMSSVNGRRELWKSDGTADGTVKVKSFTSGSIGELTVAGNKLYFSHAENDTGYELWVSNGTGFGTYMVEDIVPGPASSSPKWMTSIGNVLYFTANGQIWRSSGNAMSTYAVTEFSTDSLASFPEMLTRVGNKLAFVNREELWITDGDSTGLGAARIQERIVDQGKYYANIVNIVDADSGFYFFSRSSVEQQLWISDGTAGGTRSIYTWSILKGYFSIVRLAVGNILYFFILEDNFGHKLWRSDGTTTGTVPFIKPAISRWNDFMVLGGKTLFFSIDDGSSGFELWKLDLPLAITMAYSEVSIRFHPNPFTSHTTLETGSLKSKVQSLKLYSLNGQLLREEEVSGQARITLHRNGLPAGMYFVEVAGEDGVIGRGKVIVH